MSTQRSNAYAFLREHAGVTGAELARALKIPARSARRYVREFQSAPADHQVTISRYPLRGVVFDIEATDFGTEGYSGYCICVSFLPLDSGDITTLPIRFDEHGDDKRLLMEVSEMLSRYAYHIGHNVAAFDYNWLNSRLMYHRLPLLKPAFYYDTYQIARTMSVQTRKSLGNLIDYFGLDGEKTTIRKTSWSRVRSHKEDEFDAIMKDVVYHCEQDVFANRELFYILHHYGLSMRRGSSPWKMTKFG